MVNHNNGGVEIQQRFTQGYIPTKRMEIHIRGGWSRIQNHRGEEMVEVMVMLLWMVGLGMINLIMIIRNYDERNI